VAVRIFPQPGFDPASQQIAQMRFAHSFTDRDAQGKFAGAADDSRVKMTAPEVKIGSAKLSIFAVLRNQAKHGSYAERLSPFGAAAGKHFPAVVGGHPATEAMGVLTGTV